MTRGTDGMRRALEEHLTQAAGSVQLAILELVLVANLAHPRHRQEPETAVLAAEVPLPPSELTKRSWRPSSPGTYGESKRKLSYDSGPRQVVYDPGKYGRAKKEEPVEEYLLVDGYNILYAWDELREL